MLEEADIRCPYCGEAVTVVIDLSVGDQCYVEDCFVCCQPIALDVRVADDGSLAAIEPRAEQP